MYVGHHGKQLDVHMIEGWWEIAVRFEAFLKEAKEFDNR